MFWHSIRQSIWHIYLAFFHLAFYLAFILAFYLTVEVQQCPLGWGGPRLRSSGAHWDRCPLRSGAARSGGGGEEEGVESYLKI